METLTSLFDTKGCPLDKQKFTWREEVRRAEQHQATMDNRLLSADYSPLETTVAYEQVAIEMTAAVAQNETDPYRWFETTTAVTSLPSPSGDKHRRESETFSIGL